MNLKQIKCPCCGKRLLDLDPEADGSVHIGIKCCHCKNVVAITIKNRKVSTEQMAARTK